MKPFRKMLKLFKNVSRTILILEDSKKQIQYTTFFHKYHHKSQFTECMSSMCRVCWGTYFYFIEHNMIIQQAKNLKKSLLKNPAFKQIKKIINTMYIQFSMLHLWFEIPWFDPLETKMLPTSDLESTQSRWRPQP